VLLGCEETDMGRAGVGLPDAQMFYGEVKEGGELDGRKGFLWEPKTRRDDEVKGDDFVECEGSVERSEG
jgi:hypothetical protein